MHFIFNGGDMKTESITEYLARGGKITRVTNTKPHKDIDYPKIVKQLYAKHSPKVLVRWQLYHTIKLLSAIDTQFKAYNATYNLDGCNSLWNYINLEDK